MAGEETGQVAETTDVTTGDQSNEGNESVDGKAKKPASAGLEGDLFKERKLRQQIESELNELKTKNLSEQERVVKERDDLKSKVTELEATNKRQELALKLKMPWSLAKRIQGDTPEEMEADAKELLSNFEGTEASKTDDNKGNSGGTGKKPPTNDGGKAGKSADKSDPNKLLKTAFGIR